MALDKAGVRASSRLQDVIPALLGVTLPAANGSHEPAIRCPFHEDGRPSFRVNLQKQLWRCDPCDVGGDVFELVQRVQGIDFPGALQWLAERAGLQDAASTERRIEATYDYVDERGTLLFQVVRFTPKDFRQRQPAGEGWSWKMAGVRRVVYGLDRLRGREAAVICEGEKDVDALWALGLPATTNSGGAGKWTADYSQQLVTAGVKRVVLVPDNDDAGRAHMQAVGVACLAAGLVVKLANLPDVPVKGDVSDYLKMHGKDDLIALIRAASDFTAPESSPAVSAPLQPVLVCMKDVQPEQIEWIWPQRLARGKLTLLIGDPGVGKSTVVIDVAAHISVGAHWPDGERAPLGSVILLANEDGLADTVRPRLDRQGADVGRVFVLKAARDEEGNERHFSLERDLAQLETAILEKRPTLIAIDPLSAYFGTERDSYKDTEVRAVLAPLVAMAEKHGVAVLGLVHMTKATQNKALYRAMASIAFVGQARIVLAAGIEPNTDRRLLMPVKQNICQPPAALAFAISDDRLVWDAEPVSGVSVDAVLSGAAQLPDEDRDDAALFLTQLLADGAVPQPDVERAGKGAGFSMSQLRRAQKRAGAKAEKSTFRGGWVWRLEPPGAKVTPEDDAKTPYIRGRVIFGENVAISGLDSTAFPKITAVSSSALSSGPASSSDEEGWEAV